MLYIVTLASMLFAPESKAEFVSQKQASKIAATFFNASRGIYTPEPKFEWNGRQLTTNRLFAPFYIYNHPPGGFVIVSADSKAFPILGYSLDSKFSKDKMSEDERELLQTYAREIELIRYDSRIPDRAKSAWENLPQYITDLLSNPYNIPEFENLSDSQKDTLEMIDRRNNAVMMPSAVEFPIYNPQRYRDYTLDDVTAEPEEEIPFKFYEDFIAEIEHERKERARILEEILSPVKPVVKILGGAHFSISFPQCITQTSIFSMQGLKMQEKYYKDTQVANLDLSALPTGFYIVLARDNNGRVYGLKLYR